jgi:ABC-type transport system involved in multi-copper enzyme maturation permease subunit
MSRNMSAVASAVLVILIVALAWWLPPKRSWFIVMALLWAFFLLLGLIISKRPLGILVNEQNVMSLSRFQTVLWTIIVISAFLVIGIARVKNGVLADEEGGQLADPLNITIGNQLLALLGISAASLVGSPLVAATKKSKTPDPNAVQATAKEMVRTGNIPDSAKPVSVNAMPAGAAPADARSLAAPDPTRLAAEISNNADGILYKNPSVSDASFTDIFEGNEIGNTAHVDLGKVQMFFFTVLVAIAYVAALWDVLSEGAIYDSNFAFPVLSDGMVALLGISNASYLASKGVNHT